MRCAILLLALLVGCATGPSRYEMEARAYAEYLTAEVNAGRMTDPQAKYLLMQKVNQLVSQKNGDEAAHDAAVMNAFGIYNQMQPRQPINCTTFQRGQFGNINCQ